VLIRLRRLYSLQEEAAANATAATLAARRTARLWMLLLSGGALGLAIGIALHVVGRTRRAEASLQQEKERAQVTLHSIGDGVIRTDQRGNVEYLNPVAERLTGWSNLSAHGVPLLSVLRLRDEAGTASATDPLSSVLREGETVTRTSDLALQTARDADYAIELTAAPIHGDDGAIVGAVLVFRDVTEMRTLDRELSYQASHDALTGLLNRREFERRLQQLLDGARRHDQTHALGYIDLDLFKVINDTCGHIAGDELLRQLGLALRARLRKSDVLARLGGDEIGVLLANCPLDRAEQVVAGLQRRSTSSASSGRTRASTLRPASGSHRLLPRAAACPTCCAPRTSPVVPPKTPGATAFTSRAPMTPRSQSARARFSGYSTSAARWSKTAFTCSAKGFRRSRRRRTANCDRGIHAPLASPRSDRRTLRDPGTANR
jgi:diguanylate cyclase (GGDEF)-like protein/PAS domain S-box-containing protein